MGAEGAIALSVALKANSVVESLNLCNNEIGEKGGSAVASALTSCKNLTFLDLSSNGLGIRAGAALAKSLESNKSLKEIRLSGNNFRDRTIEGLCSSLSESKNKALEVLDLSHNNIGSRGATAIGVLLEQKASYGGRLRKLNLSWNQIRDASGLLYGIQAQGLTDLNLSWNGREFLCCKKESLGQGCRRIPIQRMHTRSRPPQSHAHTVSDGNSGGGSPGSAAIAATGGDGAFGGAGSAKLMTPGALLVDVLTTNISLKQLDLSHNNLQHETGMALVSRLRSALITFRKSTSHHSFRQQYILGPRAFRNHGADRVPPTGIQPYWRGGFASNRRSCAAHRLSGLSRDREWMRGIS